MSKDIKTIATTQASKSENALSILDYHATPQSRRRRIRNSVAITARRAGRF